MIRCKCGTWTNYGIVCVSCHMQSDREEVEETKDEADKFIEEQESEEEGDSD